MSPEIFEQLSKTYIAVLKGIESKSQYSMSSDDRKNILVLNQMAEFLSKQLSMIPLASFVRSPSV